MNFRTLAFAASFCVAVASLASAQHCDSCHRSHAVWHGYCDKGCGGDACCDPCCTRRYGLLRGIGRVVVGAVRVVDHLIPRPCVNCACSPCCGSGHSVGCSDGCCGSGGGDYQGGEVIHSGSAPMSEEILPTPAPAEATHSIRKSRSVISSGRKKTAPTPARLPRQVSAKPTIETESKVSLADYEEEAADEVPTLVETPKAEVKKPVTKTATTVAKKKSESNKSIPVNPLR